jgi:hypothetical protein
MTVRISHLVGMLWLLMSLATVLGLIMAAYSTLAVVVSVWAVIISFGAWKSWPVWIALRLRRIANVLFGERYADDIGLLEEDALSILEAARNIHNWGSRNVAAVAGLATVVGLWLAPEHWEPFVGLAGLVGIVGATHFPAIRRRLEEWGK